ncbi:MAG: hypothetical protein LBF40_05880 [Deltaproteobacteria bacterium]|jgi:hypothetical protein|nr:hypothetical protein [Deltaproteobacteria bacterium]
MLVWSLQLATIELFEIKRFIANAYIFFGASFLDTRIINISDLIKGAQKEYSNFSTVSKIYNNNAFFESVKEESVYILVISNGSDQGLKVLKFKAGGDKDSAEVLFGLTCTIVNDDMVGKACINPVIIENGNNTPISTALESNNIIVGAMKSAYDMTWKQMGRES